MPFYLKIMEIDEKVHKALSKHVPERAVDYSWVLWKESPFHFYITKSRQSKLGDFRFRSDKKFQTITINHDLNPYQFLITYLHEVAHYRTYVKFGLKVKPHGPEWKKTFHNILLPVLNDTIFPKDILIPLKRYAVHPLASTMADPFLAREISKYNKSNPEMEKIFLFQLASGSVFSIRGRRFQKESMRRTRAVCMELATGKKYLISSSAQVEIEN